MVMIAEDKYEYQILTRYARGQDVSKSWFSMLLSFITIIEATIAMSHGRKKNSHSRWACMKWNWDSIQIMYTPGKENWSRRE